MGYISLFFVVVVWNCRWKSRKRNSKKWPSRRRQLTLVWIKRWTETQNSRRKCTGESSTTCSCSFSSFSSSLVHCLVLSVGERNTVLIVIFYFSLCLCVTLNIYVEGCVLCWRLQRRNCGIRTLPEVLLWVLCRWTLAETVRLMEALGGWEKRSAKHCDSSMHAHHCVTYRESQTLSMEFYFSCQLLVFALSSVSAGRSSDAAAEGSVSLRPARADEQRAQRSGGPKELQPQ